MAAVCSGDRSCSKGDPKVAVVCTVGLPGSGKSTWCADAIKRSDIVDKIASSSRGDVRAESQNLDGIAFCHVCFDDFERRVVSRLAERKWTPEVWHEAQLMAYAALDELLGLAISIRTPSDVVVLERAAARNCVHVHLSLLS